MNAPSPEQPRWLRSALLGWVLVAGLLVLQSFKAIATMHFGDPDDALRMVQVRDLLSGQPWFDLHQYRLAPPAGVVMHWSRLVDAPLAGVILLLRPLVGEARAELAAAVIVPLLTLLAAQLCLARLVARKLDAKLVLIATLLMLLMIPAVMQVSPLRIDHHGWQIVAVVAALNALIAQSARAGTSIAGWALGFGMAVSLELLPFAGLLGALFAWRWWRNPAQWRWLSWYLDALVLASGLFFLATRGVGDLTNYCDAMSPPYLAGLAGVAVVVQLASLRPAMSRPLLLASFGAAAVAGAALFLHFGSTCTRGPFAALDPLVRTMWYDNVREGMPVWRQDWAVLLQMLIPPLAGLGAAIVLARRTGERFWQEYVLVLAGAVLIGVAVSRFSSVSSAIAIVPLAWLVRQTAQRLGQPGPLLRRLGPVLLLLVVLLPGLVFEVAGRAAALVVAPPPLSANPTHEVSSACSQPSSMTALARQPRGTILTQLDLGPFILLHTQHSVLASGHHRATSAMHDSLSAFLAPPDQARAVLAARHIAYVLVCPDLVEARMEQDKSPKGLAALLLANQAPPWLEPVNLGSEGGIMRLWRVKPQPGLNSIASPSMQ